jgi:DNA-binding transcriptional ArsR family regulator
MPVEYNPTMDFELRAFHALSDPTRLALFNCVRGCGGASAYDAESGLCDANDPGSIALCDIKCKLPCGPSTLSHHIEVLKAAELMHSERRGRKLYLSLNINALSRLASFLVNTK